MSLVRSRGSPICTCHDKAAQPATTPVVSLNDGRLLAKWISGDVIAQELIDLMYHAARLTVPRLEQMGIETPNVHPTRLKENLLVEIPELNSHQKGRDILLAFQTDVGYVFFCYSRLIK